MAQPDSPVLLAFCNESVRPVADKLAGILSIPETVIAAVAGQELAEVLGTDKATLFRTEPWEDSNYEAIARFDIPGSNSGGRPTILTNHDVIGIIRVMVAVKGMIDLNDALRPLVGKVAVNPRP